MTSPKSTRDPLADHLLTPQNAALLISANPGPVRRLTRQA
jgi:hypothetical protein